MKNLTYHEMCLKLQERFPQLEILDNIKFSSASEIKTGFWLRNGSQVTYTEKDKNVLYKELCYDFKNYDFEVYKKFDKWCNKYGWYATSESYTLQLFKI